MDEEKIQQDVQWDGLRGVITNIPKERMHAVGVLEHYHGLWQIEETFRLSKHDLRMRHIYHWTPPRIKAHIAICFMVLMYVRLLEYRTRLQYKKMSQKPSIPPCRR
ncbi:MAG: transposase [Chitinophagales bacterium]|nr:transposase [Chitinophagales bacterium]MDW8419448.1 transposase [Chitinophagales bacterium]